MSSSPLDLVPVRRRHTLADDIVDVLRARVMSGDLAPGDQLPTEHKLAEAFQVSRAVVRESLARLKQEGLVESRQGRGVFVLATPRMPHVFDKAGLHSENRLKFIAELRMAVEPTGAALAAQRWTPETLAEITAALDDLRTAVETGTGGPAADTRFHRGIAAASGNPLFQSLLEFIGSELMSAIDTSHRNTWKVTGGPMMVQREHEHIYESILARDAAAASDAMRSHLRRAATRLSVGDIEPNLAPPPKPERIARK